MHIRHGNIAAIGLLVLLNPGAVTAQRAQLVEPGVHIRLTSPVYTGVATAMNTLSDTLRILVEGLGSPVAVPLTSLERLERRRRATAGERALRGATWGAIVGVGLGAISMLMADPGPGDPPRIVWPVLGAAVYGGVGALIGLPIPQYRWDRVPLSARENLTRGGAVQRAPSRSQARILRATPLWSTATATSHPVRRTG